MKETSTSKSFGISPLHRENQDEFSGLMFHGGWKQTSSAFNSTKKTDMHLEFVQESANVTKLHGFSANTQKKLLILTIYRAQVKVKCDDLDL